MLEIGLLNIDDRQYNIDNDDDSRVDENGKIDPHDYNDCFTHSKNDFISPHPQNLQNK